MLSYCALKLQRKSLSGGQNVVTQSVKIKNSVTVELQRNVRLVIPGIVVILRLADCVKVLIVVPMMVGFCLDVYFSA
jgi:hypothetical protein